MTDTTLESVIPAPVAASPVAPEPAPVAAIDPALSATAQRIADLQMQVATLQQKLNSAEQRLTEATRTSPNIEVCVQRNIGEKGLEKYLNAGWGILHMQFINITHYDGEEASALHVVLQRMTAAPLPTIGARPTMTATAAVPVPPPIPRPQPQPARVVSGSVIGVDDNAAPLRTAVENYVHTILKDKTLTADERNQRLTEQAIANVRARAAERDTTGGASFYRPITAMEMSL
jgi:hypothetical protein